MCTPATTRTAVLCSSGERKPSGAGDHSASRLVALLSAADRRPVHFASVAAVLQMPEPVRDFRPLSYHDQQATGRGLKALVEAGMDLRDAQEMMGI